MSAPAANRSCTSSLTASAYASARLSSSRVVLVDGLLRHRERARQRDLDRLVRVGAQKLDVAHLDGPAALDRSRDDRHRNLVAGAADDLADAAAVDAVERVRELVRVAFAPDLAVRDDVDAGALLVADRFERRFVLRLLEPLGRHAPHLAARARAAPSSS